MLVVEPVLSKEALACLATIKALDLSPIEAKLIHSQNDGGWTQEQTRQAIGRYKTFLWICYLYPELFLVPTEEIDRVWHCHILHTRQYRQDCQQIFGRFMDHEPNSIVTSDCECEKMEAAFTQTQALLALFEKYFIPESPAQSGQDIDWGNLHLYRSACGRP